MVGHETGNKSFVCPFVPIDTMSSSCFASHNRTLYNGMPLVLFYSVYQSRSARQAKQRQAELDRVRREAEAKALAAQSTVGGRRRRRAARRHRDDGDVATDMSPPRGHWVVTPSNGSTGPARFNTGDAWDPAWDHMDYHAAGGDHVTHHAPFPGIGPPVSNMARACPPDD